MFVINSCLAIFGEKYLDSALVFSNFTDNFCESDEVSLMMLQQSLLH
jgi:hypothetical protein